MKLHQENGPDEVLTVAAARQRREQMQVTIGETSLGSVLVAQSANGLIAVLLGDDRDVLRRDLESRFPDAVLTESDAAFDERTAEVIRFVDSPAHVLNAPLDMHGSEFQRKVWKALREIPAGKTASYADVANSIGRPTSARAVATACAANHLAVVVPCHRVVRSDGQLSGYRWGIERKRALLRREAIALEARA